MVDIAGTALGTGEAKGCITGGRVGAGNLMKAVGGMLTGV